MQYLITFLEGIISFISPCMLPLLPVYISFFAGETGDKKRNALIRSLAFVLGFSIVFCLLGFFAGALGGVLKKYQAIINIICGAIVVIFGLSYLEIIPLKFFKGLSTQRKITGVFSAFVFGLVYSVSLTPCVGAFLGSAIMLAGTAGSEIKGLLLLMVYSLGLGVPFVFSAVLLDRLKNVFSWIKKHYKVINIICGVFLIIVGVCMMCGLLSKLMALI